MSDSWRLEVRKVSLPPLLRTRLDNDESLRTHPQMIDIPSVSGDEKAVGVFLASHLESLGYQVEMQEVAADRFNVIATTATAPRIVFSTHMDTVPPHILSSEDDQRIHGRGSCDAKGIIAAQISAAERLRAEGINAIGLLFTVDEEIGSLGAQVANKAKLAGQPEYLINGEPTDNKLARATKGSLRLKMKTSGRAAHSAYPEQGDLAIERLLDILEEFADPIGRQMRYLARQPAI